MDHTFSLETPEQVAFEYEVAGIGSRFIAAIIDTLILIALYIAFFILVIFILSWIPDPQNSFVANLGLALLVLVSFALFWGYYVIFEIIWNGQTPGKRLTGLRVIQATGYPETPVASVIRNIVRLVDFLPASYGLGIIVMFFNSKAMRLGDFAAGTLVVKERPPLTLDQLAAQPSPLRATPSSKLLQPAIPNLERLGAEELHLVREVLRRSHNAGTAPVVDRLALTLRVRLSLSPNNPPVSARDFLAMIAAQTDPAAQQTSTAPPSLLRPDDESAGALSAPSFSPLLDADLEGPDLFAPPPTAPAPTAPPSAAPPSASPPRFQPDSEETEPRSTGWPE